MTNADYIRSMTNEQLEEFIERLAFGRETPWSKPFADKYCTACPVIEAVTDRGIKMQLSECDFADSECPHGSDILWWLSEAYNDAEGLIPKASR